MKFEENWPMGFEEKSFKGVDGQTDVRRTDDRRGMITIAHPEPSAQIS